MGCTSSVITAQKIEVLDPPPKKETAFIQVIIQDSEIHEQSVIPLEPEASVAPEDQQMNTKMKKQKQKIHFLQQSQNFMRESVQISTYVHQAILSLTYNPLLHDEAYYKLIGVNKKILEKKQNRMNNLVKREEKAEQELKKEREKRIEKTRSEIISYRFHTTKEKNQKYSNKQNKDENIYRTFSKESFAQRMSKIQHEFFDSAKLIM